MFTGRGAPPFPAPLFTEAFLFLPKTIFPCLDLVELCCFTICASYPLIYFESADYLPFILAFKFVLLLYEVNGLLPAVAFPTEGGSY